MGPMHFSHSNRLLMKMVTTAVVSGTSVSKRTIWPFVEDGDTADASDEPPAWDVHRRSSVSSSSPQSSEQSSIDGSEGIIHEMSDTSSLVAELEDGGVRNGNSILSPECYEKTCSPALDQDLRFHAAPGGHRPVNFGLVIPGVYRSSFPQAESYGFIQGLGLRTIVTLVSKELPESYHAFIGENGIRHHVISMQGTKKESIPIRTMNAILGVVLDPRNHPLLIHCNHGKHRTGCVVAVVRKAAGWDLSTILEEYKTYAEPKVRECDVRYISNFQLSNLSGPFVREMNLQLQVRNFFRATCVTVFVLIIWLFTGSKLDTRETARSKTVTS